MRNECSVIKPSYKNRYGKFNKVAVSDWIFIAQKQRLSTKQFRNNQKYQMRKYLNSGKK